MHEAHKKRRVHESFLIERIRVHAGRSSVGPPLEAEAAAAATVFQSLTEGALRDAVECAHLDEAEGEAADDAGMGAMAGREEWFARAAAIGRACAAFSAGLLCTRMQQKQQHLQHCAAAGWDYLLLQRFVVHPFVGKG